MKYVFQITEAQVNEGVNQMISQNRAEYENLLIKASQPPPNKVTQGCVFIEHLIAWVLVITESCESRWLNFFSLRRMLEHELNVTNTTENSATLKKIQDSGVKCFYYLVDNYTEEASLCPPTKQLITTCVERLGQVKCQTYEWKECT